MLFLCQRNDSEKDDQSKKRTYTHCKFGVARLRWRDANQEATKCGEQNADYLDTLDQ